MRRPYGATASRTTASLAALLAVAGVARAQPVASPAQNPPQPVLVAKSGVGGCIFRNLPQEVSRQALTAVLSRSDIGAVLRGPVGLAAPKCTARPPSDPAVVGSVFSVYSRSAAAYFVASQAQIQERQLLDAWAAATPAEKAPFVASARTFLSPAKAFAAADPAAVTPFEARLGLAGKPLDSKVPAALPMYFTATALSELSEADLAAAGR
jgi:hypothetical protein